MKGDPGGSIVEGPDHLPPYSWRPKSDRSDNLYGVPQSAKLPNRLKPGQLDWNLAALRVLVPLSGVKTVGDLVTRVGQVTHLEVYADKRYESKSLTILGSDNGSAPASDLLQAVAYCVTGAFRQVGPAFVLTDDVVGVEARRAILIQFGKESALRLKHLMDNAADSLGTKHSLQELATFDDPLALNAAEKKNFHVDDIQPSLDTIDLPLNQLTPAQQQNVRQQAAGLALAKADLSPDLNGKMGLTISPHLELLVPSLNSPVETPYLLDDLFDVTGKLLQERTESEYKNKSGGDDQPPSEAPQKAPFPLSRAMAFTAHRAVLLQPSSAAELASAIAAMKRLGFNELWLDVFSQGHVQTALPDGKDLLAEALHLTRGSNIHVYAVVDLFQWGTDTPTNTVDVDALGETSAQAETRLQREAAIEADSMGNPPPIFAKISGLFVTPFNLEVRSRLMTLVKSLAKRPGLAGIVLRRTAPGGYDEDRDAVFRAHQPDLGYILPARLAFLRQEHTDPIDVTKTRVQGQSGGQVMGGSMGDVQFSLNSDVLSDLSTTIPGFNDQGQDALLSIAWDKYRRDADVNALRNLYDAIQASHPNLPILVQQQHHDFSQDWYGSWDSRNAPLPEWKILFVSGQMEHRVDRMAKLQSHVAQVGLEANDAHDLSALSSALEGELQVSGWDGFVWDTTQIKPNPLQ